MSDLYYLYKINNRNCLNTITHSQLLVIIFMTFPQLLFDCRSMYNISNSLYFSVISNFNNSLTSVLISNITIINYFNYSNKYY